MAQAVRRNSRAPRSGVYGNLAYAEPAARPLERGGAEILRPQPKARPRERVVARPKVQVRQAGAVSVFAVLGFLAVGVCAIVLMMSMVTLTTTSDEVIALRAQLTALQNEGNKLAAQYEMAYDLSAVEERAVGEWGMVKLQSGQVYLLDLSEENNVVHYRTQEETAVPETPARLLETIMEYFN